MSLLAVLALIGTVFLLVATLGVGLMKFRILWQYSRDAWRRTPVDRRPRSAAAGVFLMLVIAALGLALALQPWGSETLAWVVFAFAGAVFLWGVITAAIRARDHDQSQQREERSRVD